jgi:hypothetical protein
LTRYEILLGWTCARCGHQGAHGEDYAFHRHGSGECKLKPAVVVIVPSERERATAVSHAMASGYSREDAEAIVQVRG